MASLNENVAELSQISADIKNAIVAKGSTPSGAMDTYASAIRSIPTSGGGTDVSDTTAEDSDVLAPKKFHKADGSLAEGTIEKQDISRSNLTYDASESWEPKLKIQNGYYNESSVPVTRIVPIATINDFNITPKSATEHGFISLKVVGSGDAFVQNYWEYGEKQLYIGSLAEELGVTPEKIVAGETIMDVEGIAAGGVRPGLDMPISVQIVDIAKQVRKTVTWTTGKAKTIFIADCQASSLNLSSNNVKIVDVESRKVINCNMNNASTLNQYDIASTTGISDVSETSVVINHSANGTNYRAIVLVFGDAFEEGYSLDDGEE